MPLIVVAAGVLVVSVWMTVPTPAGADHAELARLQAVGELLGLTLTIIVVVTVYRLYTPDVYDDFASLRHGGGSRPFTFTAGRVLVGLGGLVLTAGVIGIVIGVLDYSGNYLGDEAVRLAVQCANAVSLFMLAIVLTYAAGRILGVITAFFLQTLGADAAYQKGALSDSFIPHTGLIAFEQLLAWLAPPQLVDPLTGIAVIDLSVALQQFPVREGHAVWGTDLIQPSSGADIVHYFVYLAVLSGLLYIVCRRRAAQATARAAAGAIGAWTRPRKIDDTHAAS